MLATWRTCPVDLVAKEIAVATVEADVFLGAVVDVGGAHAG